MRSRHSSAKLTVSLALGAMLILTACAAGDSRYTIETPAGFWHGLWHGIISVIAFVISLFNDRVEVYERFNNGAWYDLGFLLGILSFWGGGSHANKRVWPRKKTANEKEWQEIGKKVEAKIQRKIRQWAEAEPDEDWEVVGEKAEAKLKKKLREWAEEDETSS
jgi:hypothetical protein